MSNMNHRQYSHYESSTSRADVIANKSNRSFTVVVKWIVCLLFAILFGQNANAQSNMIHGVIKDSITSEPLQYINIYLKGENRGVFSNQDGRFSIKAGNGENCLQISSVGYKSKEIVISQADNAEIEIFLSPSQTMLKEIVIRPTKERYSKKNNPAVDMINHIRKKMHLNNPLRHDYYNYEKYEKGIIALNDFNVDSTSKLAKGKYGFITQYIDTSDISGRPILIISMSEKTAKEMYRKSPKSHKEIIEGTKISSIIEVFDEKSLKRFVDEIMGEIDIFQNDISIMQNRFVSPLSNIATNYYKFYITDTIPIDSEKCIELSFTPHNKESFGFIGRLYLPLGDTTMFVKKAILNVPKSINLNYVKSIYIVQDFIKAADGTRLKVNDDLTAEFEIVPGTQGLYSRRQIAYRDFSFIPDAQYDSFFDREADVIIAQNANQRSEEYWNEKRQLAVNHIEMSMNGFLSRLRQIPFFYWTEQVVKVIIQGYIPTGKQSKFDIGPVNTMLSFNRLEGTRFRIGGVTTALLHNQLFARGYVAYGLADRRFKYGAELEYSFNKKENHSREFPIHSIKAEHKYDIDQIGQHYLFTNKDNIFLSLKRRPDYKSTYQRISKINYKMERESGFSFDIGFKHEIQEGTKSLPFEDGFGNFDRHYHQSAFMLTLRYAPGEKFYQTKSERIPINIDAPIFQLTHEYGPKGMFGSKFTLNRTEFSVQKRFWFSAFGYTDIILKAGKVWSQVQYPALMWPNANLSYTIQPESYSLMNAMEFANDQYVSWDITYWANGALFNRIPLIKHLKLREVVSFKGLYGSLTRKNNPDYNNNLYRFPFDSFAKPMGKDPYMEISVGIDNILTFLRIDYVWRLTYRNTPNIDKSGLRVQLHFTF